MKKAEKLIKKFDLHPHPEGGWYKQTYKSSLTVKANELPRPFNGERSFATSIYFLLQEGDYSAFHRIKSDECWHFYSGDPILVYVISENGSLEIITLGSDFENGELFQYVVAANCWFASRPARGSEYCFVGCTVSPGFEFDDFELAKVDALSSLYPNHRELIAELCRH
jgi:predicted cupin superfamily sugar epimerase